MITESFLLASLVVATLETIRAISRREISFRSTLKLANDLIWEVEYHNDQ